jgi:hypothetical protein
VVRVTAPAEAGEEGSRPHPFTVDRLVVRLASCLLPCAEQGAPLVLEEVEVQGDSTFLEEVAEGVEEQV